MKDKPLKVLIIADGYPTSKNILTGIFVKEQVDELRKKYPDWQISVYFNPFFKLFSNPLKKQSVFWNAAKWSLQLICFFPYLFKKYDLIHAHRFFLPVINGAIYKFFHNKPLIVTSHGIVQIRKRYNKRWTQKLFHYCNLIIAVNNGMKEEFISNFNLPRSSVVVRSCGINFSQFDCIVETDRPSKNNEEIMTLGFVGDFSENKRPYYFIKCIEALHKKYNIKGIMIGGGKKTQEIRNYVRNNNLPILVEDTLPHNEVIYYYTQFDVLIFPSESETFGIVGIEALYCNVPVIASAVGGKMDYIQDNINGVLFENNNINNLINKTEQLLSNREKLKIMKEQTRKSVKYYSNKNVVEKIGQLYYALMER